METILMTHPGSGGGPWFLLFPLLWIALFATVFLVWRGGRSDQRWTGSAEEILAERFARAEISADDFRQAREVLRRRGA